MKFSAALALIVVVGLVASSSALPAKKRMVYMQAQPQWYGAPQRMMYVQYVQPSRTHARSTQAASALVAGESVATGTYLNEADIAAAGPVVEAEEPQQGEDAIEAAGAHSTQAVAEAYPEEELQTPLVEAEVAADAAEAGVAVEEEVENTDAKVPRDYHFDAEAEVEAAAAAGAASAESDAAAEAAAEADAQAAAEAEAEPETPAVPVAAVVPVEVAADLPAPAPIAPVAKPARRYLPANKKVYVELEQSAEADEDEEEDDTNEAAVADAEEDDDEEEVAPAAPVNPVRVPNARRPTKKAAKPVKPARAAPAKPAKPSKPLPAGTFFPIDFGGTSGGAIAIANSFSTGEGGSATSHAIAYGSPDAARARVRPSKFH